ncbi:MAG: trimethylamine methyltransferase family protein [Pseudomonadota bacterium]
MTGMTGMDGLAEATGSGDEPAASARPARRRAANRRAQQDGPAAPAIQQRPHAILPLLDRPTEPLDEEQVAAIDDAAMRVLEEVGIEFLHEDALAHLRAAGCTVEDGGMNVRMDRGFVREMVARAPAEFTITPRNPAHAVPVGGRYQAYVNVSSPPNCMDLDRGRRPGTQESFRDLLKLSQYFNCIHILGGYPVEPVDIHASVRHLHCLRDKLILTDKVMHGYALGTERIEDAMEMVRLAYGLSHEEFEASPRMYTNINSSSPLKHDWPMLDGAMRLAKRGQPVIITPFTLAGAMAPVTIAGAVVQQTAECLAAVALLEWIAPGAPCVMGTFTNNTDMRSGAPAFGTPEYVRATQMSGQMARFYGLPMRASNACAANVADGQAVWESMNSLWACQTAGANIVYHAAGWLEGGLCASYEKFVMDCEVLQQFQAMQAPIDTSPEALAVEAIAEVGPNGHFFGAAHTQARYKDAFYGPFLSDWRNYEAWEAAGAVQTPERANALWKKILAEFEPPALEPDRAEALNAFVERRITEGGAPTDF